MMSNRSSKKSGEIMDTPIKGHIIKGMMDTHITHNNTKEEISTRITIHTKGMQYFPAEANITQKMRHTSIQATPNGILVMGDWNTPKRMIDSMSQKTAPRIGYTGLPRREGNVDECYYFYQRGHRKSICSFSRKHQKHVIYYSKKPTMAKNAVTPSVNVMIRAQRATAKNL